MGPIPGDNEGAYPGRCRSTPLRNQELGRKLTALDPALGVLECPTEGADFLLCVMITGMQALELKIPPPVVAVLMAGAMWGISLVAPLLQVPAFIRLAAAATIALAGGGFSLAGAISIRRAGTTVNAMNPETTSSLVCSGIYGATRNPMYVGLLFVLVALAIFLSTAWALLGPLAFVLYLNRFQIAPEERALSAMFGADYSAYKSRVRRWL